MFYANSIYGIDNLKLYNILSKACRSFAIVFLILNLNNILQFNNKKITFSSFFEIKRNYYNYDQIKSISSCNKILAPNGNITDNKQVIIEFDDLKKYESIRLGNFKKDSLFILAKILPKTNLKIKKIDLCK